MYHIWRYELKACKPIIFYKNKMGNDGCMPVIFDNNKTKKLTKTTNLTIFFFIIFGFRTGVLLTKNAYQSIDFS